MKDDREVICPQCKKTIEEGQKKLRYTKDGITVFLHVEACLTAYAAKKGDPHERGMAW